MKLLIITQTVDRTDPILGFFHGWINEFANHCEHVLVITQNVGVFDLPNNVEVLSLGKETGKGKVYQILMFWKYIWKNRKAYDSVFVHMTPIWIILGALVWKIFRKPMFLWYEIKRGSLKLSLAHRLVKNVFMASEHGMPFASRKQIVTGHGINTTVFAPDPSKREPGHLLSVGRVTAIKHYEVILKILADLPENTRLTIAGGTITESDKETEKNLRELMHRLNIADRVQIGWVAPDKMPLLLQRSDVFVHASQGGLDKAVLQAMACGVPVVSTSEAALDALPHACQFSSVSKVLSLSSDERASLCAKLRSIVQDEHELTQCISHIVSRMQQ